MTLEHQKLTERIIGCAYAVQRELGGGFLESVYEHALLIALREAGLAAEAQAPIDVVFRGPTVGVFRADLVVERTVILEIKAGAALNTTHDAQLLNYLKATRYPVSGAPVQLCRSPADPPTGSHQQLTFGCQARAFNPRSSVFLPRFPRPFF